MRIKIIDGYKLSELILKNCPEIASKLINEEIDLSYYSSETLTNDILLKALGFDKKINLKSIYTDIDFSLGKHTTKLFFNTKFNGHSKEFSLNKSEWEIFKLNIQKLEKELYEKILNENVEEIETKYKYQQDGLKKWEELFNNAKITFDNVTVKKNKK